MEEDDEYLKIIRMRKDGKVIGTIEISQKRIFRIPDDGDDPIVIWVWDKRLKPATTIDKKVVIMNLYSLEGIEDVPEDINYIPIYLSAVMVEELTHCYTKELKNHRNWINWLTSLHLALCETYVIGEFPKRNVYIERGNKARQI